jgi:hypothetical protein
MNGIPLHCIARDGIYISGSPGVKNQFGRLCFVTQVIGLQSFFLYNDMDVVGLD